MCESTNPNYFHRPALALDQLIARLFRSAREIGAPLATVRNRLRQWLDLQPPDHFLLIEPDEELRKILDGRNRPSRNFPGPELRPARLPQDSPMARFPSSCPIAPQP